MHNAGDVHDARGERDVKGGNTLYKTQKQRVVGVREYIAGVDEATLLEHES